MPEMAPDASTWSSGQAAFVTSLLLAAFGEEEGGEIHAVDLSGGVYRLFSDPLVAIEYRHATFDHYFATALPAEIALLDAGAFAGWSRTGESFTVLPVGTFGAQDVCRYLSASFAPRSSRFYSPFPEDGPGVIGCVPARCSRRDSPGESGPGRGPPPLLPTASSPRVPRPR